MLEQEQKLEKMAGSYSFAHQVTLRNTMNDSIFLAPWYETKFESKIGEWTVLGGRCQVSEILSLIFPHLPILMHLSEDLHAEGMLQIQRSSSHERTIYPQVNIPGTAVCYTRKIVHPWFQKLELFRKINVNFKCSKDSLRNVKHPN